MVNEVFESEANKHIERIADIVINESCENVIDTSPSSSHIEETSQFGNKTRPGLGFVLLKNCLNRNRMVTIGLGLPLFLNRTNPELNSLQSIQVYRFHDKPK